MYVVYCFGKSLSHNFVSGSIFAKKLFLGVLVGAAFAVPAFAVLAIIDLRRETEAEENRRVMETLDRELETARYRYYTAVAEQRVNFRESMAKAKEEFEDLLGKQSGEVIANQETKTQTTFEPVAIKQPVITPAKPRSSAKTKTS
jgi:hypothetical protein